MAQDAQGRRIILPPSQQPTEPDEIQRLKDFFKEYGQAVLIGVGLLVAAILGGIAFKNYRETSALRASQLLMNARSAEEIQQVISQYPNAPVMPLALLALASRRYDEGQYEMARNTFAQLKEKFPAHPLAVVADLGRAQCLEGEGQLEAALQAFSAFAADHPNHFLTPLARFGKARCLHQLGRYDEARAEYEEFVAAYPESEWATVAESAILFVEKDKRASAAGLVSPAGEPAEPKSETSTSETVTEDEPPAIEPPSAVSSEGTTEAAPAPVASEEPRPEETSPSH